MRRGIVCSRYIPVGVVGCVYRTTMMLYIMILARAVLKETITIVKVVGVSLSIVGMFLVVQPEMIFGHQPTDQSQEQNVTLDVSPENVSAVHYSTSTHNVSSQNSQEQPNTVFNQIMGYFMTVLAALSYGSLTITQKAKLRQVHPMDIGLYAAIPKMLVPLLVSLLTEVLTFPTDTFRSFLVIGAHFSCLTDYPPFLPKTKNALFGQAWSLCGNAGDW